MEGNGAYGFEEPKKKRSRVKWFSFIFAGALIFLGVKIQMYLRGFEPAEGVDPAKIAEHLAAIALVSRLALALGGLALVVGLAGSFVRARWVRFLEAAEGLAFLGAGGYLLYLRQSGAGGGLFDSPILPLVLVVIGVVQGIVAVRELRRPPAP